MPVPHKIKRRAAGGSSGPPASLLSGELACNEQTNVLYYGKGDNGSGVATSILEVGGSGATGTWGVTLPWANISGKPTTISGYGITDAAPLASPTFTGTPAAPTAAIGTNTTQLATTAFVQSEIANDAPTKTGGGASGSWGISVTGSSASCTGNAATATSAATLTTGRTINGTSFDGSANITTASWGTARTITIGDTGKSVDGSGNVSWSLAEIGGLTSGDIGSTVQGYDADTAKTDAVQGWSAAQRGTIATLTDGTTITPDFATANNFSVTLGGNRTLANPSNLVAGQSGAIHITQDATGGRTLAFGSYWHFAGGTAPDLTATASAVDCLVYSVRSSTSIVATLITDVQ